MFAPQDWEQLVSDHQPRNALLVAVDDTEGIVGYTAAHPEDGEMFLLFVHPAHADRGDRTCPPRPRARRAARGRVPQAYLFVHEQNERALAVYAAAGYQPDGSDRVSEFRGTRIRELRLVKGLEG